MSNIQQQLGGLGIAIPDILLPAAGVDIEKWAVIACDQFTQDRNYWARVKNASLNAPSALNLVFPEVFLADGERERRIAGIHHSMEHYLREGIFAASRRGFVYVERDTPFQQGRRGLVVAVDLERYDWSPASRPLIRSTEGTVPERLPPRMDIRRNAPLEIPHILLLIDDDTGSLLPVLAERAKKRPPVYQTALMLNSGRVGGWFLDADDDWAFIAERLGELARRSVTRYASSGIDHDGQPFLFAVGDGNHSLAAARGIWEEYKAACGGLSEHPCRYALVEIENIYDPAITFEPIHRIVFDIGFDEILNLLSALPGFSSRPAGGRAELVRLTGEPSEGSRFGIVSHNRFALVETSADGIATASLQPLLDRTPFPVDYIHGADELFRLAAAGERPAAGILLPPVKKSGLFETVARSGPLPRKSFSMGEAEEKRFYIECRKLF
ncbi:MAG: DUF1015 domain-containing protein [Treponema sp.]|jgi:hypothetical protein|nr:DUF1015 domain-containing protein [Treponema sp.]